MNRIDRDLFNPLLVLGTSKGPLLEAIEGHVNFVDLGRGRVRKAVIPLANRIRRWRPRTLFSPYPDGNVALMLAKILSRSGAKTVLRESNNRTAEGVDWGLAKRKMVRWSYRSADRVVALSDGVRRDLLNRYDLSPRDVQTIYNPVDIPRIRKLAAEEPPPLPVAKENSGRVRLIAAGRLVPQKGFDLLIEAMAGLKDLPVHLTLLGEGIERKNLISLVERLRLENRVSMPGFQKNPYGWFKRSDIFVLSSRWEGFGHVIAEAMVCGVPVVATRCPSGPDEIITDNVNGLLCESGSASDIVEKVRYLVNNPEARVRLSVAGEKSAERFDSRSIVKQYEELFQGLPPQRPVPGTGSPGNRGVDKSPDIDRQIDS